MSITLGLRSFDDIYENVPGEKVLINYEDIFDNANKERLDDMIFRNYSEDNLSIIPSCRCGKLKGTYYVGEIARCCGSYVSSSVDDNISFLLWLRQPKDVERFLSPMVFINLLNRYKISKPSVRLVEWIVLPNYKIDRKQQKKNLGRLERLAHLLNMHGVKRGYNSFIQNFFKIIEILEAEFVKDKASKEPGPNNFYNYLWNNKDNIFSTHLPFPNRVFFTMESNELGKFIDKSLMNPLNLIRRLTGIDLLTRPPQVKQNKVAQSLIDLADFYVDYMKQVIFSKPGLIRQQISSSRSHFTARAVITTIAGPHKLDELHIPWSIACSLLREHVLNRLYKRGFSFKKAVNFLQYHNKIWNPILAEIFAEIIASGSDDPNDFGLPALFNRNPSLHRGSIQRVRITVVKGDVADNTFSFSVNIAPSFNADCDGDELNLTLLNTRKTIQSAENFRPHHNLLALTGPNDFTNNIKLPKTIISTLANYMNS